MIIILRKRERNVNNIVFPHVASITGCQQYGCLFPIPRETDGCFEDPGSLGSRESREESTRGGVV